ncbi:MAG: M23 family metallopeptidase [Deltaproteobacteria bacterium]
MILLFAVPVYLIAGIYFLDKECFLCPLEYKGTIIIRADSRGNGFFASPRNGHRTHRGIDLSAPIGTPVLAARSGIVSVVRDEKLGMGKYVVIKHLGNMTTLYGHLSQIDVSEYQFIRQGTIIGRVGKTGNANSPAMQPHLHFEVKEGGVPQDPLDYLD